VKNSRLKRWQQAFTLLELLITVAIITILATLSLPMIYPREQKEAEQVFLQLGALIASARAAAISKHNTVVICPGSSMTSCAEHWNTGVLVFIDNNQNRQLDHGEPVIAYNLWDQGSLATAGGLSGSLHWRVFGNRQSILISPMGEITGQNGSFTWCPPAASPVKAHQMVLNSSGRVRLATDQNGDGLREDSQGRPLRC
jgi:type IV fimbrial biogenesis protein FimT